MKTKKSNKDGKWTDLFTCMDELLWLEKDAGGNLPSSAALFPIALAFHLLQIPVG